MKYILFYILSVLFTFTSLGQQVFYQDIFKGGVTGDGIGTRTANSSREFNVHIPANSTIRKAFIFVTTYKTSYPNMDNTFLNRQISFDNHIYNLNKNDITTSFKAEISSYNSIRNGIIPINVTNVIHPTQNTYVLKPPDNQSSIGNNGIYAEYYLFIAYENSNMSEINTAIIFNTQDAQGLLTYHINSINPLNLTNDVGFSFHSTAFCDTLGDGSYVYVNSNLLGLTGGSDKPQDISCTGVYGSFYYDNATLNGLGNDIPDNYMNGADALANIQPYITNSSEFDISFQYQTPGSSFKPKTNPVLQLFFAYTSPCDTFTTTLTPDTTICYGETLQLNATGGVSTGSTTGYEWTALTDSSAIDDLSCTDCPNPVFSGDSSQVYTVRIWNNDSCSVVKPVRVQVAHPQKPQLVASATICGKNDGAIKINNTPENFSHWEAHTPTGDTLALSTGNTFTQLAAGEYNVYHVDTFGCKSEDTLAVVNSYKETVLAFTAEPLSGKAPLQVNITNNSHYTDTLIWLLNGEEQPQPFTGFSTTTAGEYEVQLIGWQNAKSCADTLRRTIWVYDNTIITVSGAISPNGDGKNDVFYIKNLEKFPGTNVWIYNRWGNLVYHSDNYQNDWSGTSQSQTTIGKGNKLPEGTYYYVIQLGGDIITKKEDRIKEGFFYLKR